MQIVLAMIEAGKVRTKLVLDDPVEALCLWSHDPTLRRRARLASGRSLTAVELQLLICEEAHRFVAAGGCEGIVPEAQFILDLWADTLRKLREREFADLAGRLDWVLKLQFLESAQQHRPELDWLSPELKHLDFMYASLDDNGLFWALEKNGFVERLVTDQDIERFRTDPPENTRAWTRAMLLRLADPQQVDRVDWDSITFSFGRDGYWTGDKTIHFRDPLGFTQADCEHAFGSRATLEDALDILSACPERGSPEPQRPQHESASEPIQPSHCTSACCGSETRAPEQNYQTTPRNQSSADVSPAD
jgi:proteasome accessory factor A